jgi:hypothetical protein
MKVRIIGKSLVYCFIITKLNDGKSKIGGKSEIMYNARETKNLFKIIDT